MKQVKMPDPMQRYKPKVLPKSLIGQAITYALGKWDGLEAYLNDGRVELCNNLVENAIRPTKLGAKNWMFFGSERDCHLAAVAFTLIENCKRQNLELRDYLTTTMKRLVEEGPTVSTQLTPQALIQRKHPQAA